jgi:hypothetical protein
MEKASVTVSAAELRARVNDLADLFMGRLEETADRIRAETQDRTVRRRALAFKIDAVAAVYTAAYHADPLAAGIDVWSLAFQIDQYLNAGAGRDAFGLEQPLARKAARDLLAEADAVFRGIVVHPDDFTRARARVEGWTKTHPIGQTLSSRPSVAALAAEMRSDERDAFVAVGAVSDTLENLSERLNMYAVQLPKQARWQAELLVSDMAGERGMEGALGDVHEIGAAARRANDLLGDVPVALGAAGSIRELVAAERRAALEGVNAQRLHTLEYVTAERLAVVAALREERIAVAAALHQERIETLTEVDGITSRDIETSLAGLRDLVDYTLWRVAALLLLLMAFATTFGVVAYRLTIGRRPRGPE